MKLIVITRPDFFDGETQLVNRLFDLGLQRLHLRKPKASEKETAEWIEQIAPPFRRHIVLHDHHWLAMEYGLGGIHLNSRNPLPPSDFGLDHPDSSLFTVSRSCHSIEDLRCYKSQCHYLFLSPVFDSISKEGYGAAYTPETLCSAYSEGLLDSNVYALGGITLENVKVAKAYGFDGVAVLGALWCSDNVEKTFKELNSILETVGPIRI